LALLVAGRAATAGEPRAGRVVVDFSPPAKGPAWYVAALEELVARELTRFQSVELVEPMRSACPSRAPRCLAEAYAAAGVQVVVLGRLDGDDLRYEVWDSWTGTRAFDGTMRISGILPSKLHRLVGEIVRPIVQRGGLLDQRPALVEEPSAPAEDTPGKPAPPPAKPSPPPGTPAPQP
jgi:hypothetical protein